METKEFLISKCFSAILPTGAIVAYKHHELLLFLSEAAEENCMDAGTVVDADGKTVAYCLSESTVTGLQLIMCWRDDHGEYVFHDVTAHDHEHHDNFPAGLVKEKLVFAYPKEVTAVCKTLKAELMDYISENKLGQPGKWFLDL